MIKNMNMIVVFILVLRVKETPSKLLFHAHFFLLTSSSLVIYTFKSFKKLRFEMFMFVQEVKMELVKKLERTLEDSKFDDFKNVLLILLLLSLLLLLLLLSLLLLFHSKYTSNTFY